MRARFYVDLNPRYGEKGQRRWSVFYCDRHGLTVLAATFQARASAERFACVAMVRHAFEVLGIAVQAQGT